MSILSMLSMDNKKRSFTRPFLCFNDARLTVKPSKKGRNPMQKIDMNALKPRLREYLMHIRPEWNGNPKTSFRCINPEHEDKNASCRYRDKSNRFKCYSCGKTGDILDAIQLFEGIQTKKDAINRASTFFGIPLVDDGNGTTPTQTNHVSSFQGHQSKEPEQDKPWVRKLIREAQEKIETCDYLASRGLTLDTAKRFGLGYDPKCWYLAGTFEDKPKAFPALVIPSDVEGCFVLRRLDPEAKGGRYRKHGNTQVFNRKELEDETDPRPVFIVEGEIDAMTIEQAGGRAVALSSASNVEQFLGLVRQGHTGRFVIATDADKAGIDAGKRLADGLKAKGVRYRQNKYFPDMEKDANENYLMDPERFVELLDEATEEQDEEQEMQIQTEPEAMPQEPDYIADGFEYDREEEGKDYRSTLDYMPEFEQSILQGQFSECTPTGFKSLDSYLGGGLFEGLTIIGAPTSVGKTSFTQQLADNVARTGKHVLFICMEMSRNEMIARSLARLTFSLSYADLIQSGSEPPEALKKARYQSLSERDITLGKRYFSDGFRPLNESEKQLLHRAIVAYKSKVAGSMYFVEGGFDYGIGNVLASVRNHQRITGKTPLVVVDYLQILAPQKGFTDKQNADIAVRSLKQLSRLFHTPVIAISSFNRDAYKKGKSADGADMTAFKDSGGIEYGCDTLLTINEVRKLEDRTREMNMDILKNRHGERDVRIGLKYVPSGFCFFDTGTIPITNE